MSLHIGILAHSAEGATLCYRTAWMEGVARMGAHNHPEITLTGVAMHHAMADWEGGNLAALRALFMADAEKLAAAGAESSARTTPPISPSNRPASRSRSPASISARWLRTGRSPTAAARSASSAPTGR